jgi:hypothetical protein
VFPRLGGSTYESTDRQTATSKHYGSRTQIGHGLKSSDGKAGISYSRSYGVDYTMKPAQDESSFVELVEREVACEE